MTDQPAPTIRRVATLALTLLLLATTVPATELAPELPDLVGSAEATHNCPVDIFGGSSDRGPGPTECDPCHDGCVPGADPCDHVDCGTDPCDHVDCNPDPGDRCRNAYKVLGDLGLYRTSGVEDCVPDPSTEPCDYAGQFISCPSAIPPVPSEPELVELDEEIRWTTTYPNEVLVSDGAYTLTGSVHNELDVPLLLNVEPHVESPSVCSVRGFSSSSAKPTPRQHEYLLFPNGTENATKIDGNGVSVLNGDSISFSVDVAVGDTTGTCKVTLRAMVQTVGGNKIYVGSQSMGSDVQKLPDHVYLGSVSGICQPTNKDVTGHPREDDPVQVATGTIEVSALLEWSENCENDDHGTMVVQYRHEDDPPGHWTNVTAARRSEPGTARALNTSVDVSKSGTYVFRVSAAYQEDDYNWKCILALIAFYGGLVAAVAPFAAGGPVGLAVAAGVIALAAGFVGQIFVCQESVQDTTSFSVLVEAGGSTSNDGNVLGGFGPELLG